MKKLLLLFAALLIAGCGEKSSSEDSESVREKPAASSESAEPSPDTAKRAPAEPPIAESPSEESSDTPNSLSGADVERLLKEAVDFDSLEERDDLLYQNNEPYSGWVKMMYDSGQKRAEGTFKDGKPDGLMIEWHQNGQKRAEGTFKDGQMDGLWMRWHKNGQKMFEGTYKDDNQVGLSTGWYENGQKAQEAIFKDTYPHGLWIRWHENGQKQSETIWKNAQKVSVKYWNNKGEEVETEEEANE